jgi:hypothetical protein
VNLRGPYERVMSWYCKYRQEQHPLSLLMTDAEVHAETLQIALTAPTLERYIDLFGRHRLVLIDYEDLRRNPERLARRPQHQLGLDIEMPPSVTRDVNDRSGSGEDCQYFVRNSLWTKEKNL